MADYRSKGRTNMVRCSASRCISFAATAKWMLHEQRIYRILATDERLAERALEWLPRVLAAEARANSRAGWALYEHS